MADVLFDGKTPSLIGPYLTHLHNPRIPLAILLLKRGLAEPLRGFERVFRGQHVAAPIHAHRGLGPDGDARMALPVAALATTPAAIRREASRAARALPV